MSNPEIRRSLGKTIWKALSLEGDFYENARNTPLNRAIARSIVILAALSYMLGSALILLVNRASLPLFLLASLLSGLSVIAGYYFWTFTIWQIGKWLRRSALTYGELLIPIGFAYAPQLLNFLTLIPLLGRPIELVLSAWSLLAVIVAVRQGLDITTRRAALICLVGWPLIQTAIGTVQVFEQWLVRTQGGSLL